MNVLSGAFILRSPARSRSWHPSRPTTLAGDIKRDLPDGSSE